MVARIDLPAHVLEHPAIKSIHECPDIFVYYEAYRIG